MNSEHLKKKSYEFSRMKLGLNMSTWDVHGNILISGCQEAKWQDIQAMNAVPYMIAHIEALQDVIDDYEARIQLPEQREAPTKDVTMHSGDGCIGTMKLPTWELGE